MRLDIVCAHRDDWNFKTRDLEFVIFHLCIYILKFKLKWKKTWRLTIYCVFHTSYFRYYDLSQILIFITFVVHFLAYSQAYPISIYVHTKNNMISIFWHLRTGEILMSNLLTLKWLWKESLKYFIKQKIFFFNYYDFSFLMFCNVSYVYAIMVRKEFLRSKFSI